MTLHKHTYIYIYAYVLNPLANAPITASGTLSRLSIQWCSRNMSWT